MVSNLLRPWIWPHSFAGLAQWMIRSVLLSRNNLNIGLLRASRISSTCWWKTLSTLWTVKLGLEHFYKGFSLWSSGLHCSFMKRCPLLVLSKRNRMVHAVSFTSFVLACLVYLVQELSVFVLEYFHIRPEFKIFRLQLIDVLFKSVLLLRLVFRQMA